MKKRPLVLWLVGLGLLLSPVYYYLERSFSRGIPLGEPASVLASMSVFKLVAAGLGPLVGALVLRVRPLSWYAIVAYSLFAVVANAALLASGQMRPTVFALFAPTGLLCVLYFVRREIRSPYFHPRLRRWEVDRLAHRIRVEIAEEGALAETRDISSSGLYVVTDAPAEVGRDVRLTLHFDRGPLEVVARVARVGDGKGGPRGFGARFDEASARAVRDALKGLRRRAEVDAKFELKVDVDGESSFSCKTFDIGPQGCFLVTDRTFRLGQDLGLTLHIQEPLRVDATVVWLSDGKTHPAGVGLKFKRPPTALRALLEEIDPVSLRRAPPASSPRP